MSFRAILFDWDGTLADTAEATYRCYERMFREFDIAFDRDSYARTYRRTGTTPSARSASPNIDGRPRTNVGCITSAPRRSR
jgi:beta-phosphoglucomutase-like phosphatase (HAD superfamily)